MAKNVKWKNGMELYHIFNFGKFKGSTLKKIMAEHGSYVGWCLENIPNFHIEPEYVEKEFLTYYNKWKKEHKGMTVHYNLDATSCLPKEILKSIVNRLNDDVLGGFA